jgi:serine phosphatase RsbU (regulator of sigma subunit)
MKVIFKSVKTKYVLTGLAICFISLLIVSMFSYTVSYNIASDLSDKRINEAVLRNSEEIDYWFSDRQHVIESLSQDIEASGDFNQDYLIKLIKSKMEIYKNETLNFYIAFEDDKRKLIMGADWTLPEGYDIHNRPWYKMAWQSDKVIFTEPYVDAVTGELVITVAKALRSNGKVIGVLGTDIYLTEVMKTVSASKINDNSYGILLDSNGKIISHPDEDFLPSENGFKTPEEINWKEYNALINTLKSQKEDKNIRIELKDYNNKPVIFNFCKIASNNWYFGIAISKTEYQKPLQNLLLGFIGVFFISMSIAVIIMLRLIKSMIEPIKVLNNAVRKFSYNNMSERVYISSEDEIGELGKSFNNMADTIQEYSISLEKKVEERTRELKEKNDTIMESIGYARTLQNAIIPIISDKLGIDKENCFSIWKPRDIVGGDMFWCRKNEKQALLAVADCTGHGVPAALMSMTLSSIIDAVSRECSYANPAEILSLINVRLKEVLSQDKDSCKINDGADMALLYIDKENRKLIFSGAKLNMFVVSQGKATIIKGTKNSVGYSLNENFKYEDIEVPYIEDGIYYFTTDGFLDQNCELNTGGMGKRRFMRLIESIYNLSMDEQRKIISNDIKQKLAKVPQRDDITVIGLKL